MNIRANEEKCSSYELETLGVNETYKEVLNVRHRMKLKVN